MRGFFRNIFPWLLAAVLAATWGAFVLWMHQPLRTQNQYLEEVLRAAGSDASECEESLCLSCIEDNLCPSCKEEKENQTDEDEPTETNGQAEATQQEVA